MPRVKIDYIVSFSSEDPDNQANNLLSSEVSKRRWLCRAGEPSCSVVLQLARSVQISAVHVGAHHAALVEVLVGRSETPNEQFQVLVPSCVFVGPAESRREPAVDRVRSFTADQLTAAAGQRWDRVRLVCCQPYNKHCKYGLSFVHVYSPEEPPAPRPSSSSSEEEYRPGQLFARARAGDTADTTDTGAQIRQATSQALKNITDSSTKLVKTPIAKHKTKHANAGDEATSSDRGGDRLVYTADDDRPHEKIDRLLHAHRRDTDRDRQGEKRQRDDDTRKQNDRSTERRSHDSRDRSAHKAPEKKRARPPDTDSTDSGETKRNPTKKRARSTDKHDGEGALRPGPVVATPHTLLADVGIVFSGYQNPERARLRSTAQALGARVLPAWGPAATHLVCAFPSTPKLRAVRAAAGGDAVPVVTADWLLQTAAHRRSLPWQWFATEQAHRTRAPTAWDQDQGDRPEESGHKPAGGDGRVAEPSVDDCDTDDEIERVIREQKRARRDSGEHEDDADIDTDDTTLRPAADRDHDHDHDHDVPPIPELFAGRTFVITAAAARASAGALLPRYILAHGGLVTQGSVEDEEDVDYVVCAPGEGAGRGGARRVSAHWVWRCHDTGRLLPADTLL